MAGTRAVDEQGNSGVWITSRGRHIFIRDGETLAQSLNRTRQSKSFDSDYDGRFKSKQFKRIDKAVEDEYDYKEKVNKLKNERKEAKQKYGELSSQYKEKNDEYYKALKEYKELGVKNAIDEEREDDTFDNNKFGLKIRQSQLDRLKEVGNVEQNRADYENAYLSHMKQRSYMSNTEPSKLTQTDYDEDLSKELNFDNMRDKIVNLYGGDGALQFVNDAKNTWRKSQERKAENEQIAQANKDLQDNFENTESSIHNDLQKWSDKNKDKEEVTIPGFENYTYNMNTGEIHYNSDNFKVTKKSNNEYSSVEDRYNKDEDFRNMLKRERQKNIDATRNEIKAYLDTDMETRKNNGLETADDLYRTMQDYWNIDRKDFDKVLNEELLNYNKTSGDGMTDLQRNFKAKPSGRDITGNYIKYYDQEATENYGKVDGYGNGRKANEAKVSLRMKNGNFSSSGEIWNSKNTDIISGGQNLDEMKSMLKNNSQFNESYDLWKNYHLNDMHAGTERQEKALNDKFGNERVGYDAQVDYLKSQNLYEDDGYRYGSSWLKRTIPKEDAKRIIGKIDRARGVESGFTKFAKSYDENALIDEHTIDNYKRRKGKRK